MRQQILCRCAVNSDLVFYQCARGHHSLVCGECLRTGYKTECPACLSMLAVEETVLGYISASPSPAQMDFSPTL